VKRYLKLLREHGSKAFFAAAKPRTGAVLKGEALQTVQRLIEEGLGVPEVAQASGVKANTLHKAIRAGRLADTKKKNLLRTQSLSPRRANGAKSTAQP
jgi:hypothetical protein